MSKFLIIGFIFVISCKNYSNQAEIEELYKTELQQKSTLLDRLMKQQVESQRFNHYSYDLAFYPKITDRMNDLYQSVDKSIQVINNKREAIILNYDTEVSLLNKFCDSVRQFKKFYLRSDLEQIKINSLSKNKVESVKNDSLLYLMLTTNLKAELYRVALLNIVGCNLGSNVFKAHYYDFFIVQASIKNGSIYNVTLKNSRFLNDVPKEGYDVNFKALKKINRNDTLTLSAPIKLTWVKDHYKSNDFLLEKGSYSFITELKFKNPLGDIKFTEMTFDFEIE
ncbi:MAG TPA: hypothetical protein VK835_13615 [Bacteroidia bacterium]|jgi:hypothetical protein|nr:hypothetical protein [Bacteroidia bacterium]